MHKLVWFLSCGLSNASFLTSQGSSRVDAEHCRTPAQCPLAGGSVHSHRGFFSSSDCVKLIRFLPLTKAKSVGLLFKVRSRLTRLTAQTSVRASATISTAGDGWRTVVLNWRSLRSHTSSRVMKAPPKNKNGSPLAIMPSE